MAELNRDELTNKYDDIFDDNSVMAHGPEVLRAFRDDIRDSFALREEANGAAIQLTPTESLGGIVAGTVYNLTAEGYLRALLVKYQAPGFSSFLFEDGGSRSLPVGTTFAAGLRVFTWATSNSALVKAASLSLLDVTGSKSLATAHANDGVLKLLLPAFSITLGESRRFRLSGTNSVGGTFTTELVLAGETQAYLGALTATSLSGAQLVGLGGVQLQGSRARSVSGVTTTGGQYLYYAYDARHGDLTGIVLDGAAPVLGAFRKLGDVPSTNATGAAVLLRVYRSNAANAFANNSLAFS